MIIRTIQFELDDLSITAIGKYDEYTDTIDVVDYECDSAVDDELDEIIIDHALVLLRDEIERGELNF